MTLKKTTEQVQLIEDSKKYNRLKISAGSGSGKTSSLAMVAEELKQRSLLLVFNKSAQQDAMKRFPPHVEVRTTHSVAYQAVGVHYQHKLTRPKGRYVNVASTGSEIAKYYGIKPMKGNDKTLTSAYIGLMAKRAVGTFEYSSASSVDVTHLPEDVKDAAGKYGVSLKKLRKEVLDVANHLWEDRQDIESDVMATHDTYMKIFQLSKPDLGYEIVYLDEAQDTNLCVLDIIQNQKCKLILVGDADQGIYSWRGSVNAMELIDCHEAKLSMSFRFGPTLSQLANKILKQPDKLVSMEGLETEVGDGVVGKSKPYTILYRTNSCLVSDAVKELAKGESVKLEIDVKDFCRMLESAYYLYKGDTKKVKHEEVVAYSTWEDFKEESNYSGELNRLAKIVEGNKTFHVIKALQNHTNSKEAHITMTTAHKSKGREWDQVVLADDFPSNFVDNKWVGLTQAEQRLLYVAATRAKKALDVNKTVLEIMYFSDQPRVRGVKSGGLVHIGKPSGEFAEMALEDAVNSEYNREDESDSEMEDSGLFDEDLKSIEGMREAMATHQYTLKTGEAPLGHPLFDPVSLDMKLAVLDKHTNPKDIPKIFDSLVNQETQQEVMDKWLDDDYCEAHDCEGTFNGMIKGAGGHILYMGEE